MTDGQNLVWITLESIRFDHTSLSDYERDTTPSLSRIAAHPSGTAFSQCITHGNWTGTSSASILTGTTPPTHGIYGESDLVLADDVATVPELLPDDYHSISIISNPNAGPARRLDRGFDEVRYVAPSRLREAVGLGTLLRSVPQLWRHGGGITTDVERHKGLSSYMSIDLAERFVATRDGPYFVYLHLGSSHHPYLPPAAYVDEYTEDLSVSPRRALDVVQSRYEDVHELIAEGGLSDEEIRVVESMYDATLAHVDHCVGRLFDAVRRQDDDTIVVVTADHGDLLGESGLAGHKFLLDDALVHVPLVTYGLDGLDCQSDEVVQHIDVLETALSRLGVRDEQFEGIDLTEETREFAVSQRSGNNARKNLEQLREHDPGFQLSSPHLRTLTSFRSTEYKLLHSEDAVELFALPDERTDVRGEHPEVYECMVSDARRWLEEHDTRDAAERERELDGDIKEHLSDMGYLV